jgi:hypothetical protein
MAALIYNFLLPHFWGGLQYVSKLFSLTPWQLRGKRRLDWALPSDFFTYGDFCLCLCYRPDFSHNKNVGSAVSRGSSYSSYMNIESKFFCGFICMF